MGRVKKDNQGMRREPIAWRLNPPQPLTGPSVQLTVLDCGVVGVGQGFMAQTSRNEQGNSGAVAFGGRRAEDGDHSKINDRPPQGAWN